MGLLGRSLGDSYSLHRHGTHRQLPHYFPSLDFVLGFPALSILHCSGLCSGLLFRLVIDLSSYAGETAFLLLFLMSQFLLFVFCQLICVIFSILCI